MVADVFHLVDDQFEFFVSCIEMRRHANAGSRTIVNNEFAAYQLFRDSRCILVSNSNCPTPVFWISRTRYAESRPFCEFNELVGLTHALFANSLDADFVDDLIP